MGLKHIAFANLLLLSVGGLAQQEWQYSQYMFNLFDANAAFAGSYQELSLAARYRAQWVGMDGAPTSQGISGHFPIAGQWAAGLRILNEGIGLRSRFIIKGSGAYHIKTKGGQFSAALSAGWIRDQFDANRVELASGTDNALQQQALVANLPSLDIAVFYRTNRSFAGIQAENLLGNSTEIYPGSQFGLSRHAHVVLGTALPLGRKTALRPSMLVRWSEPKQFSGELDVALLWDKRFWVGFGYRLDFGALAFFEWNITERLRVGYAYDYTTGPLETWQNGSHEVFLGVNIGAINGSGASIRYFK